MPNVIEYPPPVYSDILEFKALARAYDIELKIIMDSLNSLWNNFYIDSLDDYGCSRWETILGLKTNSSYTLEDRRFAIKVKFLGYRPYTSLKVKEILNNLLGEGNYELYLDMTKNHLSCKLNLGVKKQMNAAIDMLEKVVPLNISLSVELLYNTHAMLSRFTHGYLGGFTHQQLREEVFDE